MRDDDCAFLTAGQNDAGQNSRITLQFLEESNELLAYQVWAQDNLMPRNEC